MRCVSQYCNDPIGPIPTHLACLAIVIIIIIIIVIVTRSHLESSSASATNPLHAKSARSPKPSRRQCCKTCACKSIVSAALTRCTHTMQFARQLCQCRCGCRRRPGRRIPCRICQHLICPGFCATDHEIGAPTGICHECSEANPQETDGATAATPELLSLIHI